MEKREKGLYEYIPAKSCIKLSEIVYFYVLSFVPEGRLTRLEDIEKFFEKKFDVHHVDLERPINFDWDYWLKFIDNVPMHRVVSVYGYTDSTKVEKHIGEGFVIEHKILNRGPKVKDYKKYLFNFDKETKITVDMLKKVNKEQDFEI